MRILFFGSGDFAVPTLDSIFHDGHEVVTVVSQPDRPRGRSGSPAATPVKQTALELGLPVMTPEKVNAPEVVARLKSLQAELAYVAAFGQKIGAELLAAFPAGIVNLHASLLPAYRGAAPIQWAVINGESETGVSVFRLVEKMDAGPVLVRRRTGIGVDETADELHDRLARIGCDAVRAALDMLEKDPRTPGEVQDETRATPAPKLSKADGHLRFDLPAAKLAARINGLWSWPGARCRYVSLDGGRDEPVTLVRARPKEFDDGTNVAPGVVTELMEVQTGAGQIELLEIKPDGGRCMAWPDFINGRRVRAGDRFVAPEGGPERS